MRRTLAILLAAALLLSLAACGSTADEPQVESISQSEATQPQKPTSEPEEAAPPEAVQEMEETVIQEEAPSQILIAYFSWAENAILDEDVDAISSPSVIAPGNVQQLAGWVQEETGGDLFSIQVTEPYPSDWDDCLARANQERGDNARPALVETVENMAQYDTVFLGYPNWWYGVPMALLTFLEEHDLSGKQVYLFCSHGTGGLANSVDIISEAIPNAAISDNIFDCYEEDAASSQADIQSWIAELGYAGAAPSDTEGEPAQTQISVTWGDNQVLYVLNDSPAAADLLNQLPLTLEVEDYSTNEKIFYPPQELDTSNTPTASGGDGTLAYYAPWGDVVMFYSDYSENSSLFELGQVVSSGELVAQMRGTITVDAA